MFNKYLLEYIYLFWFGGSTYVTLEVFWRSRSHWTMFVLAAIIFIIIGATNELFDWNIIKQICILLPIVLLFEFVTGCIVNLWLGWNVWDYSNLPFNLYGQICLYFSLAWIPIIAIAIVVDDIIKWKFFNECKPHYSLKG